MLQLGVAKVSVVVNVVLEEIGFLPRCLASIESLASEIVIIDMTPPSSGVTKIAEKYKAVVFRHPLNPIVESVRNFGISKANCEWVLVLDPDEELSDSLREKLTKIAKHPGADYFGIPRKNIVFGKWLRYSRWWPDYNIRFFRKGHVAWDEAIHSIPRTSGKGADLLPEEKYAIIHHHYDSVDQFLTRMSRYTTSQAELKISDGYNFVWKDLIVKPVSEFLSRFFAGQGYRDGVHGLALSMLQAFSELVVYLKIWSNSAEATRDKQLDIAEVVRVMKNVEKDIHYWQADALFKSSGKFIHRLRRKLKI